MADDGKLEMIIIRLLFVFIVATATGAHVACSKSSSFQATALVGTWNAAGYPKAQFCSASLTLNANGSALLSNLPVLGAGQTKIGLVSGNGKWQLRTQLGKSVVDAYLVDSQGGASAVVTLWTREHDGRTELYSDLGDPDAGVRVVLARTAN